MTAASGADHETCDCPLWGSRMDGHHQRGHTAECQRRRVSGSDQPTLRDQLAEVLLQWWEGGAAESLRAVPEAIDSAYEYADALLPLIEADRERAKAEGGAEALEKAADWIVKTDFDRQHPDLFRAIADVLHAQARWSQT